MAERRDEWTVDDRLPADAIEIERVETDVTIEAEGDEPAVIRAEIRETRERLGETLEEIGDRLNPQHLKAQVRENIRDATIGRVEDMARSAADRVNETRNTIMDTIRENPLPAAMAGIGLAWLFINGRRGTGSARGGYDQSRYAYPSGGPYWPREYAGSPYGAAGYAGAGGYAGSAGAGDDPGALDRVRERAADLGHGVRDRAADVAGRAHEAVGTAAERVQDAAHGVAERATDLASTVADQTRQQARRVEDHFHEQPLAIGAVTLALGMAAGFALPVTEREVELMGEARDQVVDRVRELADETRTKVEHVASRVVDEVQHTAKSAAQEEGLTTG